MFLRAIFLVSILYLSCWMITPSEASQHEVDLSDVSFNDGELSGDVDAAQSEGRSRRLKRSSWSLPPNTSARFVLDYIITVNPLNNTFTYLVYDVVFRFVLPTYSSLQTLYQTLGKINDEEDREGSNAIDLPFFEEQRANDERRTVYQHGEDIFNKHGYDGRTCMLRAICELSETRLAHSGLMGKLLELVFRPSLPQVPKTMEPYLKGNRLKRHTASVPELELLHRPVEDEYTDAYLTGKNGKCWTRYYSCPVSLFKLLPFF